MKVAMVSEHASPLTTVGGVDAGGQNVHVAALSRALADRGHEVVVYTRRDDPSLPVRVRLGPGVTVEHLRAGPAVVIAKDELLPHIPAFSSALAARLAADPPALIHAHFWMSGIAAVRAATVVDAPVLQSFHALGRVKRREQGPADTSPTARLGTEAGLVRDVDRIIATCSDELRELLALGASRTRVDVVPCGVDLDLFRPDARPVEGARAPRLLTVGRLVPRKGVDDAIAAVAAIPEAELLIAGGPAHDQLRSDPEALRLGEMARELGVEHRVHLLGRVPREELPALIRSSDLVLCLPWYEPFGIVPLEAMACAVPVIGTAVGGLLDTVVDGRTGVLVPRRRPDLVAAAAAGLLADEPRRISYGRAGFERVTAGFSWDRVARSTERSYVQALIARDAAPASAAEEVG